MKVVSSNVYVAHMFGVEFYANANLVNLICCLARLDLCKLSL